MNQHKVYTNVAMCQPAVRMVWLTLCKHENNTWEHWTTPVLAIQIATVDRWWHDEPGVRPSENRSGLIANGWVFQGHELEHAAVVLDSEYGLIETTSMALDSDGTNACSKLVQLPWPEDKVKDEQEFQKHFSDMKRTVEDGMARVEQRIAKAKAQDKKPKLA